MTATRTVAPDIASIPTKHTALRRYWCGLTFSEFPRRRWLLRCLPQPRTWRRVRDMLGGHHLGVAMTTAVDRPVCTSVAAAGTGVWPAAVTPQGSSSTRRCAGGSSAARAAADAAGCRRRAARVGADARSIAARRSRRRRGHLIRLAPAPPLLSHGTLGFIWSSVAMATVGHRPLVRPRPPPPALLLHRSSSLD